MTKITVPTSQLGKVDKNADLTRMSDELLADYCQLFENERLRRLADGKFQQR